MRCKEGVEMKKCIISLLSAALLAAACIVPVSAAEGAVTGSNKVLVDDADVLTTAEEQTVQDALDAIQQDDGVILYIERSSDKQAQQRADALAESYPFSDSILFYICTDSRDWAVSTSGSCIYAFTDAGLDYIMDEVKPSLSDSDYETALQDFAGLCDDFLEQAATGKPYDTGNMPKKPLSILWIPGSILIGCLISLLVMLGLKSQLKSVVMQHDAGDYVKAGSMKVRSSRDVFLYRKVEKTKKQQNDGGSSTHTSGSGASHGGASGSF